MSFGELSVGEMSVGGIIRLTVRGTIHRGTVRRGNVFGELSVGELSGYRIFIPTKQICVFSLFSCHRLKVLKHQKQPLEMFYKKDVLKNFSKFTGKHLYQSLFLNKVAGLRPEACNSI